MSRNKIAEIHDGRKITFPIWRPLYLTLMNGMRFLLYLDF